MLVYCNSRLSQRMSWVLFLCSGGRDWILVEVIYRESVCERKPQMSEGNRVEQGRS